MEQLAVKTAVHSLLRRTAAYIRAPGFEAATLRQRNGYRLASAAMALVEQNPGSLLEAGDVATSLGVSRRALNYAFRETLGNSTYKYMLANRLNTAKRDLRANSTQSMTVTEVATNNDFYHLGRFAAQYHRLFGELPSQTLAT
jgi:AraC family ethanolamine operon transcriptional activator